MSDKIRVLGDEMVFVIPWDPDKEKIYLQRKDGTYGIIPFQFKYCFVGTGIRKEDEEDELSALKRKLEDEMTDAKPMIIDGMRFWKTFHLRWGKSIVEKKYADKEGYTCHVFVRMMENQYEMMRLEDAIRGRGRKRATPACMSLDDFKKIPREEFMGSLDIVAGEFLKEVEKGSERFWGNCRKTSKV